MTTDPQTSRTEADDAAEAAGPAEAAGAAPERPAPGGAEARELERQLDEARAQLRVAESRAQENFDRWQRAQADLANYRRRAQFEREELEKYASANLVASLLPVLDNFDRAWGSLPGQFRRLTWLDGVAMIHSQMRGTLQRVGLVEIVAEGQPFDPSLHEAVDSESGDGPPHVIAVLQAGYKLQERVIRPALVKVGPKAQDPSPASPTSSAPSSSDDAPDAGNSAASAATTPD